MRVVHAASRLHTRHRHTPQTRRRIQSDEIFEVDNPDFLLHVNMPARSNFDFSLRERPEIFSIIVAGENLHLEEVRTHVRASKTYDSRRYQW
jgi:hypothetical protein